MKKKIYVILLFSTLLILFINIRQSYAKYVMSKSLQMQVNINRAPPTVTVQYYKKGEASLITKDGGAYKC